MRLVLCILVLALPTVFGVDCNAEGTDSVRGNQCVCKTGYKGSTCQFACPGLSSGSICSGRGECVEGTTSAICTCWGTGVTGTNCEYGCEVYNSLPCGGHGTCANGTQGQPVCTCSSNFQGLNCSSCKTGLSGTYCTDRCPGQAMVGGGWDNCFENEMHGYCDKTANFTCVCTPPYITDSCRSTHLAQPAPQTLMTPLWITYVPRSAVAGSTFTMRFMGFRAAVPSEMPQIQVKFSAYYGNCVGVADGTSIFLVDRANGKATVTAPTAVGNYTLCVNWRTDWEMVRSDAVTPVLFNANSPDKTAAFNGYLTCKNFLTTLSYSACGCYYRGTGSSTSQRLNLPTDFSTRSMILNNGTFYDVVQGCCWGGASVSYLGTNWGVCQTDRSDTTSVMV